MLILIPQDFVQYNPLQPPSPRIEWLPTRSMVVYIPNNPYQYCITDGNPLPKSVFWHQISSMRWRHWQNSTLLCTSHTISIGSACLFPRAFMLEMTQSSTSITLDLRPILPLTMLWLEPIIPICSLSRL